MKIDTVLLNMSEDKIRDIFLSSICLKILDLLGSDYIHPDKLRKLVSEKFSHSLMLRDRKIRSALIMSLQQKYATLLAKQLSIQLKDNIYSTLSKLAFQRNSEREKILYEFFEEEWIEYISPKKSDIVNVEPKYTLFDHQIKAINEVKTRFTKPGSRVLLHMPTGSGKTRTTMRIISDFFLHDNNSLVIWLAHSEELCEQAIEEFEATWRVVGNKQIPIYRFYGNYSPDLLDKKNKSGLIVAGLSKMYRSALKHDLFLSILADRVNLVVMDEAHQAVADTYKFILSSLVEKHNARLLGLSATPGRTWNDMDKDAELSDFFQKSKVKLDAGGDPIDFLVRNGFIAKQNIEQFNYDSKLTSEDQQRFESAFEIPKDILDKLANDVTRNIKIIDKIEQLISAGHKRIIFFAPNISNAKDISLILHSRGHISHHVDNTTPSYIRRDIINQYKDDSKEPKIICNFGVLTTGFDAPKTSAVVIARPTKSLVLYSQMVGRAIRGPKVGGAKECTIVTVTDTHLPGFNSIADAFQNWDDVW